MSIPVFGVSSSSVLIVTSSLIMGATSSRSGMHAGLLVGLHAGLLGSVRKICSNDAVLQHDLRRPLVYSHSFQRGAV